MQVQILSMPDAFRKLGVQIEQLLILWKLKMTLNQGLYICYIINPVNSGKKTTYEKWKENRDL